MRSILSAAGKGDTQQIFAVAAHPFVVVDHNPVGAAVFIDEILNRPQLPGRHLLAILDLNGQQAGITEVALGMLDHPFGDVPVIGRQMPPDEGAVGDLKIFPGGGLGYTQATGDACIVDDGAGRPNSSRLLRCRRGRISSPIAHNDLLKLKVEGSTYCLCGFGKSGKRYAVVVWVKEAVQLGTTCFELFRHLNFVDTAFLHSGFKLVCENTLNRLFGCLFIDALLFQKIIERAAQFASFCISCHGVNPLILFTAIAISLIGVF